MSRFPGAASAATVILGGALAGVAFGAAGGTELGRTTVVEVLMVLAGGAVIAAALLWGRREPLYGGVTLALFTALAALTALSVTWSIVPELSYVEAGRTLSYLAVFAAAVAGARLVPRATPVVLNGVLIGAFLPVAYALASRIWPGTLAEDELSNRIGAPFQYWNAVGTAAAMTIPVALWLGARRTGGMASRAAAYAVVSGSMLAILLTQSRGALAAAGIAALLWFIFVPLRLRSLPVVLVPSLLAAAVATWALAKDPFSKSLQPLSAKEDVAGEFGLLVFLMLGLSAAAGIAVNYGFARGIVPPTARRRLGIAAVAAACLVPLVAFTSVAFSDRGLGGTIEDRVSELTSETDTSPEEGPDRVLAASSTRGKYWREAGRVFEDRPVGGVGAGAFAVARLRHRTDPSVTRHAHGFVAQTLADLGVVGVALTALLLVSWLVAALRAVALVPRRLSFSRRDDEAPAPRRDWSSDRIAVAALALVPVAFGLQSAIDWTWFIPGTAATALVAAGFVAGRGPLAELAGAAPAPPRPLELRVPAGRRVAAAAGAALAALVICWTIWQPEASDRATGDALELSERGRFDEALAKTEDAADSNPLTPDPLLVRASVATAAGREADAEHHLEEAVLSFPGDPQTWYRLSAFQLGTLDRPAQALETIRGALYLDPFSRPARELFLNARARQREKAAVRAAARTDRS